jgi:hypothetical protein
MLNIRKRISELIASDQIKPLAMYTSAENSNKKINGLQKLQPRHNRSRGIEFRTVEILQPSPVDDHSSKLSFKVFS